MKKIAFIDHSYHIKTKSSFFMLDLLKEFYQVDLILNDQWQTGKELDVSGLSDSYDAVVFWQLISPELLAQVKCPNILFFPMYDDSGGMPDNYWHKLQPVKVVSFSKTLHSRLLHLGMRSLHRQYYPAAPTWAVEPSPQDGLTVFFWARKNEINWQTVKKLLQGNDNIKRVHIHASADPGQNFDRPSSKDEADYHITYSHWFESREEYLALVKSCNVYIAPRLFEGIGFSFLEAMSLGKAVIAADHPTMNEYILDGVNGYLFSENAPRSINLKNIDAVCRNAYHSISAGRSHWLQHQEDVLRFIEAAPTARPQPILYSMDQPSRWKSGKETVKTYTPKVILHLYRAVKRRLR